MSKSRLRLRSFLELRRTHSPAPSAPSTHLRSFLNSNRLPVDKMITLLNSHFSPASCESHSLAIVSGHEGARLTHSHERQFNFALQSLTLCTWMTTDRVRAPTSVCCLTAYCARPMRPGREITHDMFRLWYLAEGDLLSANVPYTLRNTGQGLQRVQQSPRTYKAMQGVLQSTQSKLGSWVGSSMIHMGDHNVPNALSFIDKYTQVARILSPIIITLETLAQLYKEDDGIKSLIDSGFGGMKKVRRDILCDFFRSAFDGSGGACARRPPSAPCFAFPPRAHISHHGMECAMTDDGPPCALPSRICDRQRTTTTTPGRVLTADSRVRGTGALSFPRSRSHPCLLSRASRALMATSHRSLP